MCLSIYIVNSFSRKPRGLEEFWANAIISGTLIENCLDFVDSIQK